MSHKSYELTIGNHPAQQRHPLTREPLFDEDGNPVPLFPDQRSVKLDGTVIAYVGKNRQGDKWNVCFLHPHKALGVIAQEACDLVNSELGPVAGSAAPLPPPEREEPEIEEPDDDES